MLCKVVFFPKYILGRLHCEQFPLMLKACCVQRYLIHNNFACLFAVIRVFLWSRCNPNTIQMTQTQTLHVDTPSDERILDL